MLLSKLLDYLGTVTIGSVEALRAKTGIALSDEFYFMPVDRKIPLNLTIEQMHIRYLEDALRRRLLRRMGVVSALFCLVIGYGVMGNGIPASVAGSKYVINKAKSALAQVGSQDTKNMRIRELVKRSEEILDKANKGAATPEEQAEYKELEREYKELKRSNQQ